MLLLANAIAHFCVDGLCAATLYGRIPDVTLLLVLIYNALAFSTQCAVGLWADRHGDQRWVELGSAVLLCSGWALPCPSLIRVILIGLGNSLFHVTGGIMTLRRCRGRSSDLGLFVAPGALGLSLGVLYPSLAGFFFCGLIVCTVAAFFLEPKEAGEKIREETEQPDWISMILLTAAVAVRAIGGSAVVFPWKSGALLTVLMTLFVVAGKMLGGYVCDRIGTVKTAIVSIVPASVLIALFSRYAAPSIAGQFFVNLTMPVTLWMMYRCMPYAPGLAFGLAASALFPGTLAGQLMTLTGPALWIFVMVSFLFGLFAILQSEKRYRSKKTQKPEQGGTNS